MTYTTQQLQGMSDFEVNKALTLKLAGKDWIDNADFTDCGEGGSFYALFNAVGDPFFIDVLDYCNNANDIMPLAFERGIKLDCVACPAGSGFVYYAKSYDGELQSDYDSACRAIACLLLMMD